MVKAASVGTTFITGTVGAALGLALTAMQVSGGDVIMLPGLILAACSAALIALRQAPASQVTRFVAIGVLVLLFFMPFIAVAVMVLAGADPMGTFLTAIGLFSLMFVLAVSIVLMLAALAVSRAISRRRT